MGTKLNINRQLLTRFILEYFRYEEDFLNIFFSVTVIKL